MTDAAPNPFPRQATVALESMIGMDPAVPTIEREPIKRLTRLGQRYLAEPAAERTGRAVVLHGDHGTGKTHTLLVALERMRGASADGPGRPFVLYGRADAPDALSLYRKLLRPVTRGELRGLVAGAFARYAVESFESERGQPLSTDSAQRLRAEPSLVFEAIRNQELSRTGLIGRQERDLARIEGSGNSFERVVRAVLDDERGEAAHAWLAGEEVAPDDLSRLGAHGNLTGTTDVRMALHVLAVLAARAGRPFVLALDQAEVFLLAPEGALDRNHVGMLRAVLEDVPLESGFMVVSMNEPVWRALPRDVRQRFGPSEIVARGLTLREAGEIVRVYLGPGARDVLWPFDASAIRHLLAATGGNLRRFLQGCHVVLAARADPEAAITARSVDDALAAEAANVAPTEPEVSAVVEHLLRQRGWSSGEAQREDWLTTHTAQHRTGRTVVVLVAGAVYDDADARQLLRRIDAAERQPGPGPQTVILVVAGYLSHDVLETLQAKGPVLVAANDGLEDELRSVLDSVAALDTADGHETERRLRELREEVERLAAGRERETELVAARIRDVLAEQDARRRLEQVKLSRLAWAAEQQRITEDLAEARRQRELSELDEIRELRDGFERDRDRRFRLTVALGVTLAVIVAVALTSVLTTVAHIALSPSALGATVLAAAALVTTVYFFSIMTTDGSHEGVRSVEDLARTARSYNTASRSSPRLDLRSRNPYRRYAAAIRAEGAPGRAQLSDLIAAAAVEPSSLVRRRLVSACLPHGVTAVKALLRSGLDPATLSVAVEAAANEGYDPETLNLDEQPSSLRALAAMYWVIANESAFVERFLALVSRGPKGPKVLHPRENGQGVDAKLAMAFLAEDDELLVDAVRNVRERDLQRALDVLTPFAHNGLGAFYWLKHGELIGDIYVFLRKAVFMIGRGLDLPEA